jgi:tRNA modification GTPase
VNPLDDTIAALGSPAGAGLRAIVRVSGPQTRQLVSRCFDPTDAAQWALARMARRHAGALRLPGFDLPVEAAVALWPTARSYTGQPLAEVHILGSPPLVEALLETLYSAGARPATAGEFTQRAFLAGRLDLLQAEAVLGVIDATDDQQLATALAQLGGGISREISALREQLLLHLADLEAGLDFVDEDIEFVSRETLTAQLDAATLYLERLLRQTSDRLATTGRRAVVLAGLPNAGKSTLFNALAGYGAALVSPVRGTTRDVLTTTIDLGQSQCDLYDTAGWEAAGSCIQEQAQSLRSDRIDRADLVVWCEAGDLTTGEAAESRRLRALLGPSQSLLVARTKSDLPETGGRHDEPAIAVSATTGMGLDELRRAIATRLSSAAAHSGELLASTSARCRESLRGALDGLHAARSALEDAAGDEIIAVELRRGLDSLGLVCGAVYTDDLLDRIFSRFCIGK